MACCLTAPSHYLEQSWLIISEVQWHSYQGNFTRGASTISHQNPFENYISKISFKFPRGQWVNTETSPWSLLRIQPSCILAKSPVHLYRILIHHCSPIPCMKSGLVDTLRSRLNGPHFACDIFERIFLIENCYIWIPIFFLNELIRNIRTLVQIMVWCRWGDKPLSESVMASLLAIFASASMS